MKQVGFILILMLSYFGNAQDKTGYKTYNFDYALEYENTIRDSTGSFKSYVFVNSKDNSYVLSFTDFKSHGHLSFVHHNVARSETIMEGKLFFAAEILELSCDYQTDTNYNKKEYKWFSFKEERDTIIENDTIKRYTFDAYNKKKKKSWRSKYPGNRYIIEKGTEFILPFFHQTYEFEKWKVSKNLPKGIFRRNYFLSKNGKIVRQDFRLLSVIKYKKQITLPAKSCGKQLGDKIRANKELMKRL